MRVRTFAIFVFVATWCVLCLSAPAQTNPAKPWSLPQGTAVKDSGTRTYRFTVDYNIGNNYSEIIKRQRLTGEYTRGLPGGEVQWKNVAQVEADGPTAPFGAAQKRDFMEGFRYHNDLGATVKPDFFKAFPPTAVFERNLVWDTGMIEMFGQNYFEHLKLNEPYQIISNEDVNMPDVGVFHNHNVVLEWIGQSRRNGQDCVVISYRAFFNPLLIDNGGMNLKGRSDYWGQIYVSLASKQIEYATLYENVAGQMKLPGQDTPQPINVFRIGTFEPVNAH